MDQFNVALRMKYEQKCLDCGEADFVEDHASGDLICKVGALRRPRPAHSPAHPLPPHLPPPAMRPGG